MSPHPRLLVGSLTGLDYHQTGRGHPEHPTRLPAVAHGVLDAHLGEAMATIEGRPATTDELARVHDRLYLDALARFAAAGGGNLDPDTIACDGSWATALWAAGTGLAAVEALQRGEGDAAFVAIRPPGHHATPRRAMGFCLINNVAIAAAALAEQGERVLIVDWDVHHGNGTQDIFWNDPRVMYVSTHEWPSYPGTGRANETGGPDARGLTVNIPLPPGGTGDVALAAIDEVAAPEVERFDPTWVLISAGFDAHHDDPLADMVWSAGDFAELTKRVAAFAPGPGRTVAFLEGGYDLRALRVSVCAMVATLGGEPCHPEPVTNGGPGRDAVTSVARIRAEVEGGAR